MSKQNLKVGPAKHFTEGLVEFAQYVNGETAILIIHPDTGARLAVATVNLEGLGAPVTTPDYVWLKGWSENEGIPEVLEEAGILKRTGEVFPAGFVHAELAKILVEVNQ